MLPSGGSHEQPKRDAEAAAGDEKVDEPASAYARLQWFVVAWLVCDEALLTVAAMGEKDTHWSAAHLEMIVFPMSLSLCLLYAFGTMDSLAVGTRAVVMWMAFWAYQSIVMAIIMSREVEGPAVQRTLMVLSYTAFHIFVAAAFGWLIGVLRSELRTLISLETVTIRITGRLSEIVGLQFALAAIAVSQGIGKKANNRIMATACFQFSLTMAWLFSLAIFDVCGINPHLAVTKLSLSLVEGAALFFTGMLVLSGFCAYFISEQSQPKDGAVMLVWNIFIVSIIGAYCCTARVVWVARRRRRSKVSDSDREDPEPPA